LQQVAELSSRSALLQWLPPERLTEAATSEGKSPEFDFSEADLRYEVLLSDKGKEGKYKSIYSGISLSCRYETAWLLCTQHTVEFEVADKIWEYARKLVLLQIQNMNWLYYFKIWVDSQEIFITISTSNIASFVI